MVDGCQKDFRLHLNNKVSLKNFIFFNYPKRVSIDHYENIRKDIVEYFDGNDDIISIYEYGRVKAPGISDLDLIFVFNDKIINDAKLFSIRNVSFPAYELVMDGSVIKMNKDSFAHICYFDDLRFNRLMGKNIEVFEPGLDKKKMICLVSVLDWVPERILRLINILQQNKINISNSLCILNSFCYSLKYIYQLIGNSNDASFVIEETLELRSNWYSLICPEEKLFNCLNLAINVGYDRLVDYEKFLRKSGNYLNDEFSINEPVDLELYNGFFIRFSQKDQSEFQKTAEKLTNNKQKYIVISSYFYAHFMILAAMNGSLSQIMRNKINPFYYINDYSMYGKYVRTLKKKMTIAEINAQFLRANRFDNGLIRYGFHYIL